MSTNADLQAAEALETCADAEPCPLDTNAEAARAVVDAEMARAHRARNRPTIEEHEAAIATKDTVISNLRGVISGLDAQYRSAYGSLVEVLGRQLSARIGGDLEVARLERLVKLAFLSGPAGFALGFAAGSLLP